MAEIPISVEDYDVSLAGGGKDNEVLVLLWAILF